MNIYLNNTFITNTSLNIPTEVNFQPNKRVYDEIRGYLIYINNAWSFVGCHQLLNKVNVKRIALVLESPHKYEYDSNYNPLRPANGKTGIKINNQLHNRTFINNLNNNYIYEVKIINSIQYQTSCYFLLQNNWTRKNRDQVFRALFNKNKGNLRQDLINRITNYAPDIVINACTSQLKGIVATALKNFNCAKFADKHPSSW